MRPIPNQYEFMNQTWQIKPASYKELKEEMGLCDPMTNTITIDPSLPPTVFMQTLWHEILHSWEITMQLDLPERSVDLMALSLIHFFKTNPEFAELLLPETKNEPATDTE